MPASPTSRDLRLDFFRGVALIFIFIDHIPENILSYFTLEAFGFFDAAEVFIFISGFTAALVYGRRQHVINVLLWPAASGPASGPSTRTRQGYHELRWTTPDYTYWVVSDLGLAELQEFVLLLRQADSAAGAR